MYEITLNGKTLYNPNSVECTVLSASLHEKLNDSGYLEIVIPFNNPMYDEIQERQGEIIVYKDNTELWYGEVRDTSVDFNKNKTLYVVGEASYLNNTVQPLTEYNDTKYAILQSLIAKHNSMVASDKQFEAGVIGNNATKQIKVVTNWEYTLDAIRAHICEEEEYFKIRHVGGVRYIDILPLEDYGKRAEQVIMFGDNLLDYAEESTGEDIATACIPLGVRLEDSAIEGYESYLTCEDAIGQNGKNYVYLPSAVNRIGWITKVVHFNVLNTPEALVTAGINYLQSAQYAKLTLNLSAVDLSVLQADIEGYSVGDYVRAICEPMSMDTWLPIRERETDLINLANNKIKIGASGVKSITTQQAETVTDLEQKIPSKDTILAAALKNASQLINSNGENGNVSIRTDKNGKPYEILIMNADSIEQSTQAWRWNLRGFGHGTKLAGDSEFTWEADVAMTMDGQIIAKKGTVSGFEMHTNQLLDGIYWNYLDCGNNNLRIGFRADGSVGQIWLNGSTVITESILGSLNYASNSRVDSVDNARVSDFNTLNSRCDSLYNYIQSVHNLVKTLHGLND